MKKNTRILLFSLTAIIVILGAVLLTRLSSPARIVAPADPHCYITGSVPDSSFTYALLQHWGSRVVTKDLYKNGRKTGSWQGREMIFDSVPIVNGRFRFKVWMNKSFITSYNLYVSKSNGTRQVVLHQGAERLAYSEIVLAQGKHIDFQVTDSVRGKQFRLAVMQGGEATLIYHQRILDKQYASQAQVFNKKKLCDLKLLSGYKYNYYLLDKVYALRNELHPDTLTGILNCFAEPLRFSETGKKLQQFIYQKKKAVQ